MFHTFTFVLASVTPRFAFAPAVFGVCESHPGVFTPPPQGTRVRPLIQQQLVLHARALTHRHPGQQQERFPTVVCVCEKAKDCSLLIPPDNFLMLFLFELSNGFALIPALA